MEKVILLITIILGITAIFFSLDKHERKNNSTPSPTTVVSPTPSLTQPQTNANIVVSKPEDGQTLTLPFEISGKARVFENQLNYRIKNEEGGVLKEGSLYANSPDVGQFGNFSTTISDLSQKGNLIIEVFDYSPKDGSEENKITISVTLH